MRDTSAGFHEAIWQIHAAPVQLVRLRRTPESRRCAAGQPPDVLGRHMGAAAAKLSAALHVTANHEFLADVTQPGRNLAAPDIAETGGASERIERFDRLGHAIVAMCAGENA